MAGSAQSERPKKTLENRAPMTKPFVFDVAAALDDLRNGNLSPVSPKRRQPNERRVASREDFSPSVTNCLNTTNSQILDEKNASLQQVSPLSPLSPHREDLSRLSEEERCRFEERAAIIEYDAGVLRKEAERQALLEILGATRI